LRLSAAGWRRPRRRQRSKDTVILFAAGTTRQVSVSYQRPDWPVERSIVGALKNDPRTGVVVVENARSGTGGKPIASAFLERLVTDPEPLLFSTGTGGPVRRRNDLVLAISTNEGRFGSAGPTTRYRFAVVAREAVPEEAEPAGEEGAGGAVGEVA
jgi:hypothetical protein